MDEVDGGKKAFQRAIYRTAVVLVVLIAIFSFESILKMNWYWLGVKPRQLMGIPGIFTSPFKHHDLGHLLNNVLVLGILLIGFFLHVPVRKPYLKILIISLIANIWLWIGGRDSWHYGASGVVYGLFFYLLIIAIRRKQKELYLYILSCLILSIGFFAGLFPVDVTISYEGHLFGSIAGILVAFTDKNDRGKRPKVENVTFSRNASFNYEYKEKDKLP